MFKRLCQSILAGVCLLWAGGVYAQGRVDFIVSGKNKGSVEAMEVNGVTLVNIQRAARKFGVNVELFAASKQAKLSAKGFYGILTASLDEAIVNGQNVALSTAVVNNGGELMAPVDFFLLPAFQKSINRYVEFKDHKFLIERRYTLAYESPQIEGTENKLWFSAPDNLKYTVKQSNSHTVTVTFKNVVLKRDLHERFNTDYITSMGVMQMRDDAELKVILGPKAKDWEFVPAAQGWFVFRAAVEKGTPILKADDPASVAAEQEIAQQGPDAAKFPAIESPSVLNEEDDFEEMPAAESGTVADETQAPDTPEEKPTPVVAGPVFKEEPHPLSISAVHPKIRIVVDPGHGGKDAGAVRGRYREKDWNLAVGKELARLLKKEGYEVKMTRETDVFIALGDRAKISNNFKADLFVSIHTNATKNTAANGFQVYFRSEKATDKEAAETAALENEAMQYEEAHYNFVDALLQSMAKNEFMNESSKLSGYIQKEVYRQPGIGIAVNPKTGLRQANFYVLRGVNAPSVLIEMGFISSPKDRVKLSNATVQKKMAQGIYNGVVQYANTELKNK